MGAWAGGQSKWCRDDGTVHHNRHFHTPGSTRICTLPHRSRAPPCTPLCPHICGPHTYSLLQLHTSAHTHHTRSRLQSSSTPTCRRACADAQAGHTHLHAHTSPHTGGGNSHLGTHASHHARVSGCVQCTRTCRLCTMPRKCLSARHVQEPK